MTKRLGMVVATILAGALVACSSGGAAPASAPGLTVKQAEPTKTETATPPPTPTPVAAITPSPIGFSNPGVNAGQFPPPPPNPIAEPKDTFGMSRVVSKTLGIDHYIQRVGVVDNQMEAPEDGVYAIGWFPEFGKPGHGGNVMITAHETWNHLQGPFYGINKAKLGDEVEVHMADGTKLVYKVISNKRYAVAGIPMGDIIWPGIRPSNEEWLTMLTCGGRIEYNSAGFGEYLDRDVVVARRVS